MFRIIKNFQNNLISMNFFLQNQYSIDSKCGLFTNLAQIKILYCLFQDELIFRKIYPPYKTLILTLTNEILYKLPKCNCVSVTQFSELLIGQSSR